jgi:hypothetical protein
MMKGNFVLLLVAVFVFVIGYFIGRKSIPKISGVSEGFGMEQKNTMQEFLEAPIGGTEKEEGVAANAVSIEGFANGDCVPDTEKYVLRTTIPPCPAQINLDKYMLKSECPALPDMSKYVLKSSVPTCPPCINVAQKPAKCGACPPCPRPEPFVCPPCQPVKTSCPEIKVQSCPQPKINCKADYVPESAPRGMLASTSAFGY